MKNTDHELKDDNEHKHDNTEVTPKPIDIDQEDIDDEQGLEEPLEEPVEPVDTSTVVSEAEPRNLLEKAVTSNAPRLNNTTIKSKVSTTKSAKGKGRRPPKKGGNPLAATKIAVERAPEKKVITEEDTNSGANTGGENKVARRPYASAYGAPGMGMPLMGLGAGFDPAAMKNKLKAAAPLRNSDPSVSSDAPKLPHKPSAAKGTQSLYSNSSPLAGLGPKLTPLKPTAKEAPATTSKTSDKKDDKKR